MASTRSLPARILDVVVCVLLGVAAALFGAFVHTGVLVVAGASLPVGLALALGLEALVLVLATGAGGRVGAWVAGGSWVVTVLVLTWPRAAGDVVVPGTWYGYAYLVGGMAIAMVFVTVTWARAVLRETTAGASAGRGSDR